MSNFRAYKPLDVGNVIHEAGSPEFEPTIPSEDYAAAGPVEKRHYFRLSLHDRRLRRTLSMIRKYPDMFRHKKRRLAG
jgi:hypothetical protein